MCHRQVLPTLHDMSTFDATDRAPRWLTAEQEAAWRAYRRMRALLDLEISRDLAVDSGLSDADYDVLSNLSDATDQRWRISDLAQRMLWSDSRLSHHLARMADRGLVSREPSPDDRRVRVVALTDHGRSVLADAAPRHVESVRRHLVDLVSDDQVRTLEAIATTVVDHLLSDDQPSPL